MTREDPQFKLRLPDDLRARLKADAALNRRSLTAEILERLAESFDRPTPDQSRLDELEARIIALEKKVAP